MYDLNDKQALNTGFIKTTLKGPMCTSTRVLVLLKVQLSLKKNIENLDLTLFLKKKKENIIQSYKKKKLFN